jgi:hypothetical protein
VADAQKALERDQVWLREARSRTKWYREQLKVSQEFVKECLGYVSQAEALLAERQGWLAEFEARQAESEVV